MAPIDKSSSPEPALEREAGGGCPPSGCTRSSTRCDSPDADCSSTSSSCCPSLCGYSQTSSHQSPVDCQPCGLPLRSILKKRGGGCCCRCATPINHCMCQPIPRGCNCPPPVQLDVRAVRECTCDCPEPSPECACPPSERRFPRATIIKCPNARPNGCPFPRPLLPVGPPKSCHCARCQPCLPPPICDPCTSPRCPGPARPRNSCRPCSPHSTPCTTCQRPPPPCRKLTFCSQRDSRSSSPWATGTGVRDTASKGTSSAYAQTQEKKSGSACCDVFSNLGGIGYSTLVPSPLALVSFALLILIAITWCSGLALYRRYLLRKRICWKYFGL